MKWCSVKKYTPPACTYVFIRAVTCQENDTYDRYFVGMIEDFGSIENLGDWEMANGQELIDIEADLYSVTHFAIIDPIEIEE